MNRGARLVNRSFVSLLAGAHSERTDFESWIQME
jgi:hypothetical protein